MVPWSMLPHSVAGDAVVPHYLREPDHVWLRALLEAYARHAGRPRRALDEHLQAPLPVPAPEARLRAARRVLDRIWPHRAPEGLSPREVRAALFTEAATDNSLRAAVVRRVARRLSTSAARLEEALFADLPAERRLGPPPPGLDPGELALRINLAFAQGLLSRARRVRLALVGNARGVVRQAKWNGLLCEVRRARHPGQALLEISGPLALFRRTRVYARALASLVPQLPWCANFDLVADCVIDDRVRLFRLQRGDPVFPSRAPRPFDSQLEQRFAREFMQAAPDWDLIREPAPLAAGDTLVFPDFVLQHRRQRWRRWWLEIAGFWTADYLESKLARLRQACQGRFVLCIDQDRACGAESLPSAARVIRYRRRVDPRKVLAVLEER
jgi:hypothetical protein